jgi:hypothetical protein
MVDRNDYIFFYTYRMYNTRVSPNVMYTLQVIMMYQYRVIHCGKCTIGVRVLTVRNTVEWWEWRCTWIPNTSCYRRFIAILLRTQHPLCKTKYIESDILLIKSTERDCAQWFGFRLLRSIPESSTVSHVTFRQETAVSCSVFIFQPGSS